MRTGDASAIGLVQAGLAALNSADVVGLPDEQVRSEILALVTCLNQLTGALVDRIGTFDRRDLAQVDGQRASSTWLTGFGLMSRGAAARWLVYARLLEQLPAVAEGLRAGTVSAEQVAKIGDLVRHLGIEKVRDYDEILAQLCQRGGPVEVGKACDRIQAYEDPDGAEPDPDEEFGRREIVFSQLGSMLYIRGRLDAEGGAALKTAVEALMRPPKVFDERSPGQRRADAVVDLARGALAGDHLPTVGGERPHVGVLVTPEVLFGTATPTQTSCPHIGHDGDSPQQTEAPDLPTPDETGVQAAATPAAALGGGCGCDPLTRAGVPLPPERPWLKWVGKVSPECAQRLACDGVVWRLILDPRTGLPLDVGRSHRIVPWWMRKALWARDRSCRWPGCDVPAEWTDAHHLVFWWQGGSTEISQLISLCRFHHGLVHEGRWKLTADKATGEVRITRPDGSPYELGPSRPWTTPNQQGPAPPRQARPPDTSDPSWPQAA